MSGVVSLLFLDCAFIAHLFFSARRLPEHVASHFQFDGQADHWVSRRAYLAIVACVGPGLSLAWVAIAFALRNAPARLLGQHLAWAGCLLLGFIFGVHLLTMKANLTDPARLPMKLFWGLFGLLQIGLVVWVLTLVQ
jgi:hypothetical protein